MLASLVTVILSVIFSIIPLYERQYLSFLIYLASAILQTILFFVVKFFIKSDRRGFRYFFSGWCVYLLLLLAFGIYTAVIKKADHYAVDFMIFLVCVQVLFVIKFRYSLLLNFVAVLTFSFFSIRYKPPEIWRVDLINVVTASVVGFVLSWFISRAVLKEMIASRYLEAERDKFREESVRDELTGLSNRREYKSAIRFYISVCQHVHQTVCSIMLDVDFFKNYNDFYGHQKGDDVLKSIGAVLQQIVKEEKAFAARVGGEEFILLWTENRIAEAERVAIKLRQMIIDLNISHEKSKTAPVVTASIGLYILRGGSQNTEEDLYREVDMVLYEAKARGRNCIMLRDSADKTSRMVEILPPEANLGRRVR
ncbi:MAG: GGDEF domain-containing protein [Treponema sp.]|jgi:diguanylate cyclase (GGDEF)-like protein|nr:GGDEF domain-containing protein [Treponema sp.]